MLETECNNLDLQERRHIWSREFSPHYTTSSLVQDPGITDEEKIVLISGFQRIFGQEETKRILAETRWSHRTHWNAYTHHAWFKEAFKGSGRDSPRPQECLRWSQSQPDQSSSGLSSCSRLVCSTLQQHIQRSINIRLHQQQENKEHTSKQGGFAGRSLFTPLVQSLLQHADAYTEQTWAE